MKRKDICFAELTPAEQAAVRAERITARAAHSTFASPKRGAPQTQRRNSDICIGDLSSEEFTRYKARL